jgi:heptosyltransferase-2
MHAVVILPNWVGDVVMATPMLRALRRHWGPTARITGVMRPLMAELLAGTPWLDDTIFYDRRSKDPGRRFRGVARQLRAARPDVAVIVANSVSSAALAWLGGARRRIGFSRPERWLLLTDRLPPKRQGWRLAPTSAAEHAMDLAVRAGAAREPLRLELASTAADEALADETLARLFPGSDSTGPLIVFNDGGAFGPAKAWGAEKFTALARYLRARVPQARMLVHCGPGDRDDARRIAAAVDDPAVRSLADEPRLPFGLSKAVLKRAAAVVTSDSGPRHIAAAFGTPTVVLHGPMDPLLSRSDQPRLVEMRLDLPCSPCGRRICPLTHHDCMRLLAVEDVGAALLSLLEPTA